VTLVNDPEIVFLDEPTTGLDPRARRETWEIIQNLKGEGKTVFLTTHYMEEAEVLADRVAIISKGKIIARGTPAELIDSHCKYVYMTIRESDERARNAAESSGLRVESTKDGDVVVEIKENSQILELLNRMSDEGIRYKGIDIRKPNLEEVFLTLTGESLHEGGEEE